jgi:hypothetical protein
MLEFGEWIGDELDCGNRGGGYHRLAGEFRLSTVDPQRDERRAYPVAVICWSTGTTYPLPYLIPNLPYSLYCPSRYQRLQSTAGNGGSCFRGVYKFSGRNTGIWIDLDRVHSQLRQLGQRLRELRVDFQSHNMLIYPSLPICLRIHPEPYYSPLST